MQISPTNLTELPTIQKAMLSAETKCKQPPAAPYSDKLAAINHIIRFWKTVKSHMTTGRNVDSIIERIKTAIPKPMQHLLIKNMRYAHT